MSTKFAALPRFVVCTAIVGAMVFGLYGCAKKEAEQAETTAETPAEEVATPAVAPSVAGTYMAEVGAAEAAQKITMTLNADNTATMMVEYMSGQPAMTQTGTWAMGEMENAVNFTYGSEGATMTVPMMISGSELKVGGDMATALGVTEINLMKQETAPATPAEGTTEEGHSH